MNDNSYNPSDFAQHVGKVYVTQSGSCYFVSPDGKINSTTDSRFPLQISLVAGVLNKKRNRLSNLERSMFDKFLLEAGKLPEIGDCLAVSFTPDVEEKYEGLHGIITSKIRDIRPHR